MIFSIFRFFCTLRFQIYKYCPIITNHTSMERLFIQHSDDAYISISKNYPYDWFCGPGSQMSDWGMLSHFILWYSRFLFLIFFSRVLCCHFTMLINYKFCWPKQSFNIYSTSLRCNEGLITASRAVTSRGWDDAPPIGSVCCSLFLTLKRSGCWGESRTRFVFYSFCNYVIYIGPAVVAPQSSSSAVTQW